MNDKFPIYNFVKSKISDNMIAVMFYIVSTIVLTYPVIFKIRTHIAGGGDAFYYLWMFWYTKVAILDQNLVTSYTSYIFYPDGVHLIPFFTAFNQLLSIPLQYLFGQVVTYNILWLLSFVLGGYGTYLLVGHLTNNKTAAIIAGMIFAFSPYHYAHGLGHMGATTIQWIPFCVLYLMRMTQEKTLKNSIYAAVFFILVSMSDLQYIVYMGFFVGLLFIYNIFSEVKSGTDADLMTLFKSTMLLRPILTKYILFSIISLIGILPFTYDMIKTALSGNNFLKPDISESIYYSADLVGFFVPSSLHPLFGDWLGTNVYKFFTGNIAENTTFIGFTVLFLSIFAITMLRKDKIVKFWGVSAVFFVLMSLGPILHIMGKTQFTVFKTTLPLPYIIVYYVVPFVGNGRTLGRFDVIVVLSFAVLAGYGISEIIKRLESRQKRIIFGVVIGSLIVFEFLTIPVVMSFVDEPVFYKQIAQDKDNYALLEIPATTEYGAGTKLAYYQTIHGKPTVGGQVPRFPPDVWNFQQSAPFVRELTYGESKDDILNQNMSDIGTSVLNYYNIRYIVLHEKYMKSDQINYAKDFIQKTLKEEPEIYGEDRLTVYKVKKSPISSFMLLYGGWYTSESWNNVSSRWMSKNGAIKIYSPEEKGVMLRFNVTSFYKPRTLQVYVNDILINQTVISSLQEIEMEINLKDGDNVVGLSSKEGCQRPLDIFELQNYDSRCIALGFQNITTTELE